jgi:hypothetical protein
MGAETHLRLYIKCPLELPDLSENSNGSEIFRNAADNGLIRFSSSVTIFLSHSASLQPVLLQKHFICVPFPVRHNLYLCIIFIILLSVNTIHVWICYSLKVYNMFQPFGHHQVLYLSLICTFSYNGQCLHMGTCCAVGRLHFTCQITATRTSTEKVTTMKLPVLQRSTKIMLQTNQLFTLIDHN